jgi:hypothetical protein
MLGVRSTRLLALVAVIGLLLAIDCQPASRVAPAVVVNDSNLVAATSPLPGIGASIQTCLGGGSTLPSGCGRWAGSGPVNVVLLSTTPETPYADTLELTRPRWKAAQGGWLAARLPTRGCGTAWHVSENQIELRIDSVTRRHFKFIRPGCRWNQYWLTVGEAHTDLFERKRCGGDHMTDLNAARDALVASLVAGGVATQVDYRQWTAPGTTYPDGCGGQVTTDGRVAFVWLQA